MLSCQTQQHVPSRAPRPHVTVKWMLTVGVAVVTVLELEAQRIPALCSSHLQTPHALHRYRELGAHSPGETTPGWREPSEHGAPGRSNVHQHEDRPTPSSRDEESSSYSSPCSAGSPPRQCQPLCYFSTADTEAPGRTSRTSPCPALLQVTLLHSPPLPWGDRTSPALQTPGRSGES